MGIFTILMVWDIYAFGEKMRARHLKEVFGLEGKVVLIPLGLLIVFGWFLVAPNSPITTLDQITALFKNKSDQIIALLFPLGFLAVLRWFPRRKRDRQSR